MSLDFERTNQLGFDALLQSAESENRIRQFEKQTAHLPDTMDEAIAFYRILLRQHHAAMLAANVDETMRLREEARLLALRLNSGEPGIIADDNAPGCILQKKTAAVPGAAPLWGQAADFGVDCDGVVIRVEIDGIFGIGCGYSYWTGFSAHAVDYDKPFVSETGYRSFLGIHAEPVAGLQPDEFIRKVIKAHIDKELGGRLIPIKDYYRDMAA